MATTIGPKFARGFAHEVSPAGRTPLNYGGGPKSNDDDDDTRHWARARDTSAARPTASTSASRLSVVVAIECPGGLTGIMMSHLKWPAQVCLAIVTAR